MLIFNRQMRKVKQYINVNLLAFLCMLKLTIWIFYHQSSMFPVHVSVKTQIICMMKIEPLNTDILQSFHLKDNFKIWKNRGLLRRGSWRRYPWKSGNISFLCANIFSLKSIQGLNRVAVKQGAKKKFQVLFFNKNSWFPTWHIQHSQIIYNKVSQTSRFNPHSNGCMRQWLLKHNFVSSIFIGNICHPDIFIYPRMKH